MSFLTNLRERAQKTKERRKRANEAIEQNLTPEQKLAIHKICEPSILFGFAIVVGLCFVIAMSSVIMGNSYALREAFGDNVWEEYATRGAERADPIMNLLSWVPAIAVIILCGCYIVELCVWAKRKKKLELEILAQMNKERKT